LSGAVQTAKLGQIAELNPRLAESLDNDAPVSFVPMSAVTASTASTTTGEERRYGEVSRGYTPFINGDVLIAKITPCFENGKIAQARLSHHIGFGSTEFHVVRPHAGKSDARYLLYFLRQDSIRRDGEQKMTGSAGQRRVPEHFLASLEVPLPPLPEQRRIAAVLDCAEALRAKRRAALAQLDVLTQAMFLDLFGDPYTNPKTWPIISIGDAADVQGGLQVSASRNTYPREVPYLRVANVYRGFLNLDEIKYLRATDVEIARTSLVKNDMLIVEGHGNPDEIGRGALWDGSILPCVHQNHLIRVRFSGDTLVPLYACTYLNTPAGRQHLLRSGKTTSGLNTISVSEVRTTPIAVPHLALQHEFACRVAAVEKLKAAHRAALAELDALFASLQYRAFRGEL
jgi:type I restriction enzyme S subunit